MSIDGFAKFIELIEQHIGRTHSCRGVEQFIDVKVHHYRALGWALCHRFAIGLFGGSLFAHGSLQVAAVYHHLAHWQVVLHYVERYHGRVEVHIVVETMQFVELGGVESILHQSGIFQLERLILLECHILHSHAVHFGQCLAGELFEQHLYVRLHYAVKAGFPHAALIVARHVAEIEVIIAVVHQIGIEFGGIEMLNLSRLVGKHHIEHLAGFGLFYRQCSRHGLWSRSLHFLALGGHYGAVVGGGLRLALLHHHYLTQKHRCLKPVLIFHVCQIIHYLAYSSASLCIQKAHYIIHFCHRFLCYYFLSQSYTLSAVIRITEPHYLPARLPPPRHVHSRRCPKIRTKPVVNAQFYIH